MDKGFRSLITSIRIPLPLHLAYDQVARAPLDRPIVCAAVGRSEAKGNGGQVFIALGGFGPRPVRVAEAERAFMKTGEASAAYALAGKAYADADDKWASGEYRSHVAEVLVRRLLAEVMG